MINRLSHSAADRDLPRLQDLSRLLSELYTQLQHQGQVTVRRVGGKGTAKPQDDG